MNHPARQICVEAKLDQMALRTCSTLAGAGFDERKVEDAFCFDGEFAREPLSIRPVAFTGRGIDFGNVVRVRGGSQVQVLSIVLIPPHTSPLPIFGCELLVFSRGVHLVVLDAFPTCEHEEASRLLLKLERLGACLAGAFELHPAPDWGKNVFSEKAIVIKPDPQRPAGIGAFVPAVTSLLSAYLTAAAQGPTAPESMHDQIREARALYLKDHAEQEPAGPFLERIAGKEWVDKFVFDFLFPQWLA
jgi:hypothetical protein